MKSRSLILAALALSCVVTVGVLFLLDRWARQGGVDRLRDECAAQLAAPASPSFASIREIPDPKGSRWEITVQRYNGFDGHYRIEHVSPAIEGAVVPLLLNAGAAPARLRTAVGAGRTVQLRAEGSFGRLPEALHGAAGSPVQPRAVVFPVQGRTVVTQADGRSLGRISHDERRRHAIDIQAEVGDPVVAALPGQVVRVESGHPDLGCDLDELGPRANLVVVRHEDGSEAVYGHLMQHSARVAEGARVAAGQPIARVGNSGRSNRPHLHFHVGGMTSEGYRTVALAFLGCGRQGAWRPGLGDLDCLAPGSP